MVEFIFVGQSNYQERQNAKENFLKNLKEFRNEFEERAKSATINFNEIPQSENFVHFTFGTVEEQTDFIRRFQLAYPRKDI